jgi:hypothetical protein
MKPLYYSIVLILFSSLTSYSQENSNLKISFSGYIETFYSYDFNQPTLDQKHSFLYNYNRQNEFNLNVGLIRTRLEYENIYGSIALHSGTYVDDNYANEKIKYLSEAYLGLYIDKAKKQTIEIGIMPSHIGFESATTASNLTLTRSILAENSPYFMTGVKYSYKPSDKWNFSGLILNGWQRISKPEKNSAPSFGTQIIYKPSDKSTLNWSNFIGKEYYGSEMLMRYFTNIYLDYKWNSKWRTITGFDFGLQKTSSTNTNHANWFSPVVVTQYTINSKWQTALRAEYYQDVKNVMIPTANEFKTLGTSLNFDYLINSKMKFRTEARYFNSKEKVFLKNGDLTTGDFFITSSLCLEF